MVYKPHTVTIKAETRDGAGGTSLGSARTILCQVTPMSQGKTYQEYGIELSRPHLLMADKSEANYLQIGALVTYGSRKFKIMTPPATYDFGTAADHVSVVIEEVDPVTYNA
jgi:hypothetical protein